MKKVYLIYASIPSLLFDSKMCNFVKDKTKYKLHDNFYRGLYAWTTDKNILSDFIDFRENAKSMYTIIKREFTKDEFKTFKIENEFEKLSYYPFYNDKYDNETETEENVDINKTVVCTKEEYEESYDYGEQYIFDYMSQIVNSEYIVFKDEYKIALDILGYCNVFNMIYDGLEEYENDDSFYYTRHEMSEFNRSYGLSYYGNRYFDIFENKLFIFFKIYYEMLAGYNPDKEISMLLYK